MSADLRCRHGREVRERAALLGMGKSHAFVMYMTLDIVTS